MPLADGQVQVRNLVMGEGTPFEIINFNPWTRSVRADSQTARTWNHGDWSGAEWQNAATITLNVCIDGRPETGYGGDFDTWIENRHQLALAFSAIGDAIADTELRFRFGTREYVMFGRPRMIDPDAEWLSWVRAGATGSACAFVALDPRIYSGELHQAGPTGLPVTVGGLLVPVLVPLMVPASLLSGALDLLNAGTTPTGLLVRIDGPAIDPGFIIQRPDGSIQSVRVSLTLALGQWLEIDTAAGTVFLNGLPTASQRGVTAWDIDPYPLLAGTNTLRFVATDFNETAQITAFWRDAWM